MYTKERNTKYLQKSMCITQTCGGTSASCNMHAPSSVHSSYCVDAGRGTLRMVCRLLGVGQSQDIQCLPDSSLLYQIVVLVIHIWSNPWHRVEYQRDKATVPQPASQCTKTLPWSTGCGAVY